MPRSLLLCAAAVLLPVMLSCSDAAPSAPELPAPPPVLVLVGTVEIDGTPQLDAVVNIHALATPGDRCTGLNIDHETVLTEREGRFEAELQVDTPNEEVMALEEVEACLLVSVRPAGAVGWSLDEVPHVWFRDAAHVDTVTVHIEANMPPVP